MTKKQKSGTSDLERQTSNVKPVLLISASDSSGAAGMAVDIRVANDLGYPVICALTAVTVQGERGLVSTFPVDQDNVAQAITTAFSDPSGIGAVKIGLITAPDVGQAISRSVRDLRSSGIPVVLDPVMKSTPGSTLASRDVKEVLAKHMLPVTTVITPNRDELDELAAIGSAGDGNEEEKALSLISMGTRAVLVTGGDDGSRTCVDILYQEGKNPHFFEHPKIGMGPIRGTGCSLSTAVAVNLGKGMEPLKAIDTAIRYVTKKIENAEQVGSQLLLFPGKRESNV
jgi:hydroxymethylpyrimidine/phosphomethylpyrimidine kinase